MFASIVLLLYGALVSLAQDRTVSVVGGAVLYEGQTVSIYNPLPTLIYNCDRMAAICFNVREFLADTVNVAASMGTVPINFHYDGSWTDIRRDDSCPWNWQMNVGITCGSVTGQPNVQPGNLPPAVAQQGAWNTGPFFELEIPNLAGTGPSGMRYTCEEFPAASWVEGGDDGSKLAPQSHVNCAPMAVSCQSNVWKLIKGQSPNYPNVQSEQNWQGRAHGAIGRYAKARTGLKNPIMRFQFTTTRLGALSATAARVILPAYSGKSGTTQVINVKAKRSDDSSAVNIKCEGQFCYELVNEGFEFVEIDAQPPPPAPSPAPTPFSGARVKIAVGDEQPQETFAAATLNILV